MTKNLTPKIILIFAVLLVFLFGIFGVPKSFTPAGLLAAIQSRIHLGLDLKGGTHLILQVQVNDAVNAETDRAVERLKEDLKTRKVAYAEIAKPNPQQEPQLISIKGVPPESDSDLRSLIQDRLPDYELTSGADNSWTLH